MLLRDDLAMDIFFGNIYCIHMQLNQNDFSSSFRSLLGNGTPFPRILVSLIYLYQQMLWKKMGLKKPVGYTGINKIITSNITSYDRSYSYNELVQVLQELRKLDILCKSTSLSKKALIQPLIVKICQSQYV